MNMYLCTSETIHLVVIHIMCALVVLLRVHASLKLEIMCVGDYEIHFFEKIIEENKDMCIHCTLNNTLMYLY